MLEMNGVYRDQVYGDGSAVEILFWILFTLSMVACGLLFLGIV
jgi:hypothetical protein